LPSALSFVFDADTGGGNSDRARACSYIEAEALRSGSCGGRGKRSGRNSALAHGKGTVGLVIKEGEGRV